MPLMIRFVGFFDLNKLEATVKDWLSANKFDIDSQKITKKESKLGEYEVVLKCSRSVAAYAKYSLTVKISARNLVEADVKTNDGVKKLKKGSLDVDLIYDTRDNSGKLIETKPNWIKALFKKVEYGEMKQIKDQLDDLMSELYNKIKASLEMYGVL